LSFYEYQVSRVLILAFLLLGCATLIAAVWGLLEDRAELVQLWFGVGLIGMAVLAGIVLRLW
jgi:hypothetical protein